MQCSKAWKCCTTTRTSYTMWPMTFMESESRRVRVTRASRFMTWMRRGSGTALATGRLAITSTKYKSCSYRNRFFHRTVYTQVFVNKLLVFTNNIILDAQWIRMACCLGASWIWSDPRHLFLWSTGHHLGGNRFVCCTYWWRNRVNQGFDTWISSLCYCFSLDIENIKFQPLTCVIRVNPCQTTVA